jgi:CRP/FNR family cyclic AMP-dependent transcriptional regulator
MPVALTDPILAKCTLFRGMTSAESHELRSLLEPKSYATGDTILAEGESFQIMWIVLKGRCQVVKTLKSRGEIELGVIEAGSVFGEMSFFHPAPHSATVRALTDVEVVRLPREKYEALTRNGSQAAYKLAFNTIAVLIERLRRMDESIAVRMERNNAAAHKEEWIDFQTKLYTGWTF